MRSLFWLKLSWWHKRFSTLGSTNKTLCYPLVVKLWWWTAGLCSDFSGHVRRSGSCSRCLISLQTLATLHLNRCHSINCLRFTVLYKSVISCQLMHAAQIETNLIYVCPTVIYLTCALHHLDTLAFWNMSWKPVKIISETCAKSQLQWAAVSALLASDKVDWIWFMVYIRHTGKPIFSG